MAVDQQSPLVQVVGDLLSSPGRRRRLSGIQKLDGLKAGEGYLEGGGVDLDLSLECRAGGIIVSGGLRAKWVLTCRRCLDPVLHQVEVRLLETFEESPEEGEMFLLKVDRIDLQPMLRQAVLLELPLAPLCDESCSGPAGGAFWGGVLGEPPAGAGGAERDERWAALDALVIDSPSTSH